MLKLTIVAGPNRGATYSLQDGETSVGRGADNLIVLPSSKVSKRHCVLQVANGEVIVVDQGSSNGTFVNGVLAKNKPVGTGDRISVGDCVLQLVRPAPERAASPAGGAPISGMSDIAEMQVPDLQIPGMQSTGVEGAAADSHDGHEDQDVMPNDLRGKITWLFEKFIMPVFYGMSFKQEWRMIAGALFAGFTVITLVLSIYPLIESTNRTILIETARRAKFMARQIADLNTAAIASRTETRTEIGSIDREPGVVVAILSDLNSRILAPPDKSGQYLAAGGVAAKAVEAAKAFQAGRESGIVDTAGSLVVAVEPVKVFNPRAGRNVIAAMSVVALDTSISVPDFGTIGVIYSKALIFTGLIGVFVLLVLYRLTLKPFEVLNDDIDKVLKGDMDQVTREFQFEEVKPLWEIIGSALQRIPKDGGGDSAASFNAEDFTAPARMFGDIARNTGLVLCNEDRRVIYVNDAFEEVTGIRETEALGQELSSLARDQAFSALVSDMCSSVQMGGSSHSEEFDFSGIPYRVHVSSFGAGSAKGYVFALVRAEQD